MGPLNSVRRFARGTLVSLSLLGCTSSDEADPQPMRCVDIDVTQCAPLYPPTYRNVFERTFVPGCAANSGACHKDSNALGAQANGLAFADAEASYDILVNHGSPAAFVTPGDGLCSPLLERLDSGDASLLMPPGAPLDPREQCSIARWIDNGAEP